jgi:hypothetical protein
MSVKGFFLSQYYIIFARWSATSSHFFASTRRSGSRSNYRILLQIVSLAPSAKRGSGGLERRLFSLQPPGLYLISSLSTAELSSISPASSSLLLPKPRKKALLPLPLLRLRHRLLLPFQRSSMRGSNRRRRLSFLSRSARPQKVGQIARVALLVSSQARTGVASRNGFAWSAGATGFEFGACGARSGVDV